MKKCTNCGADNNDQSGFCYRCGAPLPQYQPHPAASKQSNTRLNILIAIGAVIAICLIAGVIILATSDSKPEPADITPADTIALAEVPTEDSLTQMRIDNAETNMNAPAEPMPATASESFTAKGTIDGYPYTIKGKWNDNCFTGTYINNYNGVKMKAEGCEAEGVLEITLHSGKTVCTLTLDDLGGGRFRGYYNNGEKPATLTIP